MNEKIYFEFRMRLYISLPYFRIFEIQIFHFVHMLRKSIAKSCASASGAGQSLQCLYALKSKSSVLHMQVLYSIKAPNLHSPKKNLAIFSTHNSIRNIRCNSSLYYNFIFKFSLISKYTTP